ISLHVNGQRAEGVRDRLAARNLAGKGQAPAHAAFLLQREDAAVLTTGDLEQLVLGIYPLRATRRDEDETLAHTRLFINNVDEGIKLNPGLVAVGDIVTGMRARVFPWRKIPGHERRLEVTSAHALAFLFGRRGFLGRSGGMSWKK